RQSHDLVALLEGDSLNSGRGPAHGAHVRFAEANTHAGLGNQNDVITRVLHFIALHDGTACQLDIDQAVSLLDGNCDDAAFADIGELTQGGFFNGALLAGEEDFASL